VARIELTRKSFAALAAVIAAALLVARAPAARADGVAQVMTSKSLPAATVAVIDPESGTSSGTAGSDVRVAVGDIILFRFAFTPVPDKINRGLQGYLTEYLPPNTELVGVRITDATGNTIEPRYPGVAVDGCIGGSVCNTFNSLPCATGTCSFATGSIAQVHADTGVFYGADARLVRSPDTMFITMNNGITMNPQPATIAPGIVALLNDTTGPYFAHNAWDWDQVRAYGTATAAGNTGGDGNTPYLYGSPVAGPDTYYRFEATAAPAGTGPVQFNNALGPWQRVRYPGSTIGTGAGNIGASNNITRALLATTAGFDLKPATPAPARAVRVALGETRTGEPGFVEIALRVTGVPIDPRFAFPAGGNVDCGEVFGTDTSSRGGNSGGRDNPWPTYVASPACVYLRLLFDLEVDKALAVGADTLTYTLRGKNLAVAAENDVVARLKYDQSRQAFVGANPAPASNAACVDDATKQCLSWNLGALMPSAEYTITARFAVGGGGQTTNIVEANYVSASLPAPGFSTQAITIVTPIAVPRVTLAPGFDPTVSFAVANGNAVLAGTVANAGTAVWSQDSITFVLPAGWSVNGNVVLGGTTLACSDGCGTSRPTYAAPLSYDPAQARALALALRVPAGTAAGLYPIEVQTWGSQGGFGGSFETYFRDAATVPVGRVRTVRPTVSCPIGATALTINGTAEAGAAVAVRFNLLPRGTAVANPMGAWSSNDYGAFGELYAGLEVTAVATAPGELTSEPSLPCFVSAARACSDGLDNDNDGLVDFPADPGCDSALDASEVDPPLAQCRDGLDNDGDGAIDWPADSGCQGPDDPVEIGIPACMDGVDNDLDGDADWPADADCTGPGDGSETRYAACQDGVDNDADGRADYGGHGALPADPGCHSLFDDSEDEPIATAADASPRLLLVFDSSGSMNWNTCADVFTGGDGSGECPGAPVACMACMSSSCANPLADDARLYKVKAGITSAVAAFGEVEYALMRFHQRAAGFACPTARAGEQSGGWQGGGAAPCGGGFAAGDLLVSFADDNEQTLLGWIDGDSNYPGVPPVGTDWEIRGTGTTPLAGALTSARDYIDDIRTPQADPRVACRPYRVILITDGAETCGGNPVAAAQALAGDGVPVHVIGFATPDAGVIANLDAIAAGGGTGQAIFADDDAQLSAAIAQIIADAVIAEECNSLDDDCDTLIDEDFPDLGDACTNGQLGACARDGVRVCAGSGTACTAPPVMPGVEVCNGLDDDCDALVDEGFGPACACVPVPEVCNGVDDDCDGAIDEPPLPGVGQVCGFDVGECSPGALACVGGALVCQGGTGPAAETCNLLDDDCDSFVDEVASECFTFPTGCGPLGCTGTCRTGVHTCAPGGGLGPCVGEVGPAAERCNGLDDDCDALIDESFPGVGGACDNGQLGVCRQLGTLVCDAAGTGVVCTAPTVTPGLEVCNGLDDDCDGQVDEQLGPPIGGACGGVGSCNAGTFACVNGQVVCEGSGGGMAEICNALDDDCDSFVDELPLPGVGGSCTDPGFEQIGGTGECELGALVCENGQIRCDGYIGPRPEICNGLDDDCDGLGDAGATCPVPGQACLQGECANPCAAGEFPCPFGFFCEMQPGGDFCVRDPCATVTCDPGFGCVRETGLCVDLCVGVTCPSGLTCFGGLCQDCFALGCPAGQLCIRTGAEPPACVPDPCFNVDCEDDEACRDGLCVATTCAPACAAGQRCVDGTCVADPCSGVNCALGQICRPSDGACVDDACEDVDCPPTQVCRAADGGCITDPCLTLQCPSPLVCEVDFDGAGVCVPVVPDRPEFVTAAGGGCATSRGGAAPVGVGLLLAALAALRPRRRRPR
jgi:hypothetical protein